MYWHLPKNFKSHLYGFGFLGISFFLLYVSYDFIPSEFRTKVKNKIELYYTPWIEKLKVLINYITYNLPTIVCLLISFLLHSYIKHALYLVTYRSRSTLWYYKWYREYDNYAIGKVHEQILRGESSLHKLIFQPNTHKNIIDVRFDKLYFVDYDNELREHNLSCSIKYIDIHDLFVQIDEYVDKNYTHRPSINAIKHLLANAYVAHMIGLYDIIFIHNNTDIVLCRDIFTLAHKFNKRILFSDTDRTFKHKITNMYEIDYVLVLNDFENDRIFIHEENDPIKTNARLISWAFHPKFINYENTNETTYYQNNIKRWDWTKRLIGGITHNTQQVVFPNNSLEDLTIIGWKEYINDNQTYLDYGSVSLDSFRNMLYTIHYDCTPPLNLEIKAHDCKLKWYLCMVLDQPSEYKTLSKQKLYKHVTHQFYQTDKNLTDVYIILYYQPYIKSNFQRLILTWNL